MTESSEVKIHELATMLFERSLAGGVVVVSEQLDELRHHYPETTRLYIASSDIPVSTEGLPANTTFITPNDLTDDFMADKILVFPNSVRLTEFISRRKRYRIRHLINVPLLSVFIVNDGGVIARSLFKRVFRLSESSFVGRFANAGLVAINGQLTKVAEAGYPKVKVLAIISQYNEKDISSATIEHLLGQGIDVHVIDNWSTDGGYEMVMSLKNRYPGRLSLERFPSAPTTKYEWVRILERVEVVARSNLKKYKWIMHNDSDEIRWSPWPGIDLQTAISFVDHLGYTAIDYTVFNFRPTSDGFDYGQDPFDFFQYGEFDTASGSFVQVKTWQNHRQAEIASSGGHRVLLPVRKIYPLKFLLCHYPLRSNLQAKNKIFKDRLPRFLESERKKGMHVHYGETRRKSYIYSSSHLIKMGGDFFDRYLVERLSGVGLKRDAD